MAKHFVNAGVGDCQHETSDTARREATFERLRRLRDENPKLLYAMWNSPHACKQFTTAPDTRGELESLPLGRGPAGICTTRDQLDLCAVFREMDWHDENGQAGEACLTQMAENILAEDYSGLPDALVDAIESSSIPVSPDSPECVADWSDDAIRDIVEVADRMAHGEFGDSVQYLYGPRE